MNQDDARTLIRILIKAFPELENQDEELNGADCVDRLVSLFNLAVHLGGKDHDSKLEPHEKETITKCYCCGEPASFHENGKSHCGFDPCKYTNIEEETV